jgi:hypothetical protein
MVRYTKDAAASSLLTGPAQFFGQGGGGIFGVTAASGKPKDVQAIAVTSSCGCHPDDACYVQGKAAR